MEHAIERGFVRSKTKSICDACVVCMILSNLTRSRRIQFDSKPCCVPRIHRPSPSHIVHINRIHRPSPSHIVHINRGGCGSAARPEALIMINPVNKFKLNLRIFTTCL